MGGSPLPIVGIFARNWWVLLFRGMLAIVFGILALRLPLLTLTTLVLLFGVYAAIDGGLSMVGALTGWGHRENRWLLLLEGLIGVGASFVMLRSPVTTAVALTFFIAAWALATGTLKIVQAIRLRREISGEFWLALSGILSVAFAFLIMLRPVAGTLTIIWVIGWYALVMGVVLIFLSFELRGLRRHTQLTEPQHRRAA